MDTVHGHLYDYPKYYDVIFGSDWKAEYHFLQGCWRQWARRSVRRIFEPGCGTGRLLVKFAQDGYDVSGLDLNPRAVDFCNARLRRKGLRPAAFVGDMAQFRLKHKVDVCFNMINTFRHLPDENAALSHLHCIAACLRKGGLYILGLHLTPQTPQRCTEETWSATRGQLSVVSRLWSIDIDLRRRKERIGMTYDVYTPSRQFRIQDETTFRTYTAGQMQRLFDAVPHLEVVETYDFRYDLEWPIEISPATEDVVYVLRKK
uniref:Class I SAM-dependent methyltransferase n=1 Tax=Schlesneria paludicola TaxID=360056 RepID=A0A7C4LKB6_9PLAN